LGWGRAERCCHEVRFHESKCVCGRGAYSALDLGEGIGNGEQKWPEREREQKGREREKGRGMEIRGQFASLAL